MSATDPTSPRLGPDPPETISSSTTTTSMEPAENRSTPNPPAMSMEDATNLIRASMLEWSTTLNESWDKRFNHQDDLLESRFSYQERTWESKFNNMKQEITNLIDTKLATTNPDRLNKPPSNPNRNNDRSLGIKFESTPHSAQSSNLETYRDYSTHQEDEWSSRSSQDSLGSMLGNEGTTTTPRSRASTSEERFRQSSNPGTHLTPRPPATSDNRFRENVRSRTTPTAQFTSELEDRSIRTSARTDQEKRLDHLISVALKIKKYDGPEFDCVPKEGKQPKKYVDDWIQDFERWFNMYVGPIETPGLTDSCVQVLSRAIYKEQNVYDWLNTRIEKEPFRNWKEVKQAIHTLLMPVEEIIRRGTIKVITDCIQGQDNMALYVERFKACTEIYNRYREPGLMADTQTIARSFYSGITDPDIKDMIWIQCDFDINNVARLQEIAIKAERDTMRQKVFLGQGPSSNGIVKSQQNSSTTNGILSNSPEAPAKTNLSAIVGGSPPETKVTNNSANTAIEELARELQDLKLFVGKKSIASDARGGFSRSAPRDISKDKCYNCQGYGHHSTTCPDPKNDRTQTAHARFNTMMAQAHLPIEERTPILNPRDVFFTTRDMQEYVDEQVSTATATAYECLTEGESFHRG